MIRPSMVQGKILVVSRHPIQSRGKVTETRMSRTSYLTLFLILTVATSRLFAGDRDEPFRAPVIEREEVRFITFDLAVEEQSRDGWRPARDLRADEITLLVGGKRTPLDLFESRCAASPSSPPEAARNPMDSATGSATPAVEGAAAAPAGADVVRYVLYFEETHLTFVDGRRSLKAALEWAAATARPQDEAMIVVGGRG